MIIEGLMKTVFALVLLFGMLVGVLSSRAVLETVPDANEWGVLFTADQSDQTGLYWIRPNGTGIEQVFHLNDVETDLLVRPTGVLSPDGQQIVLTLFDLTSPYKRYILFDLITQQSSRLTQESVALKKFYWSPDGKQIAYLMDIGDDRLYLIKLESGEERLLALAKDVNGTRDTAYFTSLDWSPNGEALAIAYLRGDQYSGLSDSTIVLTNPQTGEMVRALKSDNWAFAPTWGSSDTLYYICRASSGRLVSLCALDVPRRLSLILHDFTPDLPEQGYIRSLDVAPDGRMILSFDDGSGRDLMYLFDIQLHQLSNLTAITGLRGTLPRWALKPN